MSGDGDGTQFTVLGRIDELGPGGLTQLYAHPEPEPHIPRSCWVRGNMIASIDGGATSDGKSGALGRAGDRAVFAALREVADVVVVGASTARVENYAGVQLSATQRRSRQLRGQAEVPPIAVLTRSGRVEHDARVLRHTEVTPLILTSADAVSDTRARLGGFAEVLDASGGEPDSVDLRIALGLLADRGLVRVLTEGGPGVLGMFTAQQVLDEMCLTVAPVLVGGASHRIVTGPAEVHTAMRLRHALTDDDGYLYLRYSRSGAACSDAAQ
ncbi:Riboflavin biosynthesis protein RibD [Mycolicibacterium vanbaalenii]|uniref:Riboflavin biosynthesis protein RibD n=1 Tax=Mycolicibacterium vanbaalenii TaxID=110539 RepID=A0A5S9RAT1_MYCVN|nr:pyrimidine reductase family protein [Mycolicibacterium vanbaalenii]CAA0136077.1 Riboflavin biosynthesis protein RibD [Mycolicibacterium vanbaalenii]